MPSRKQIIKYMASSASDYRLAMIASKAIVIGNQFGFIDGYRAYLLNKDYGYPHLDKDDPRWEELSQVFEDNFSQEMQNKILFNTEHYEEYLLPDRRAVDNVAKAFRRNSREETPKVWAAGRAFNVHYFKDFLDMFPTVSTVYGLNNDMAKPIFTYNFDNECGVLCPCRVGKPEEVIDLRKISCGE